MTNEETNSNSNSARLPALYSPAAIYLFSVLFNTVFGAVLMIRNFVHSGKKEAIRPVIIFTALHMLFQFLLLIIIPGNLFITFGMNVLGGFILHEHFWKKYFGTEVNYTSKRLFKPLLISFLVCLPFLILLYISQAT